MGAIGVGIMDSDQADDAAWTLVTGLLNMNMVNRNWREYPEEIKQAMADYGQAGRIVRHLELTPEEDRDDKAMAFAKVYMFVGADIPGRVKELALVAARSEYSWNEYDDEEGRKAALNAFIEDLENYKGESVPLEYQPTEEKFSRKRKKK